MGRRKGRGVNLHIGHENAAGMEIMGTGVLPIMAKIKEPESRDSTPGLDACALKRW
jgi:hypothetical protein